MKRTEIENDKILKDGLHKKLEDGKVDEVVKFLMENDDDYFYNSELILPNVKDVLKDYGIYFNTYDNISYRYSDDLIVVDTIYNEVITYNKYNKKIKEDIKRLVDDYFDSLEN